MAIILANDGIDKAAAAALVALGHEVDTKKYEGEDLLMRLAEVDVVVVRSATKIRNPEIDAGAAGNLKLIIRAGVGIDNINHEYAREKGIEVTNTPAASSNAVAELALTQMLVLSRHIVPANLTMREGKWNKKQYSGTEIAGKTLGLIGYGRIARSLADKARALGMQVIFTEIVDVKGSPDTRVELPELLERSDYISLHIPFAGGKAVLGREEIARMKDGVKIINCARGGVVDEDALYEGLVSGKIGGASLDVFAQEPLAPDSKLLSCERISFTPHIGAATKEAQARIGDITVELIKERF